ncbi:protein EMBRYO DEFECTIVE 514-like [Zingiber officinale]|uniref:Uncharacterized protein n=1 Tax=Zingiber officinale TaxID=94328 RepID=A0A8J5INW1_ZINOF|nr:protein EMBRYO DEFECTIVE 514-like [Zingiber officinale]KAG6538414.1 hypothetical protein ZIOFF_003535 [Zingiber officinale]
MAEELTENHPQMLVGDERAANKVKRQCVCDAPKQGREDRDEEGPDSKRYKLEKCSEAGEKPDGAKQKEEVGGNLEAGGGGSDQIETAAGARIGPKAFRLSTDMFEYFLKLLRSWPPNLNLNKYEHLVMLSLLEKGHPEPAKKIGKGIEAFQVRYHPTWKNRCFFIVRVDGSADDFSFRKCVDNILPLPDHMKVNSASNNLSGDRNGSRFRGGGRRGGRGYGRKGKH